MTRPSCAPKRGVPCSCLVGVSVSPRTMRPPSSPPADATSSDSATIASSRASDGYLRRLARERGSHRRVPDACGGGGSDRSSLWRPCGLRRRGPRSRPMPFTGKGGWQRPGRLRRRSASGAAATSISIPRCVGYSSYVLISHRSGLDAHRHGSHARSGGVCTPRTRAGEGARSRRIVQLEP